MITKEEIKVARRLKGPSQMERVRAARAIINGRQGNHSLEMAAFLDIFHPEISNDLRISLMQDAREKDRRR